MSSPPGPRIVALALAALGLMMVAGLALVGWVAGRQQATQLPPDLGALPAFSLIDQGGAPVSGDTLRGSAWVAGFVFTRCPLSCPRITAELARLDLPRGVRKVLFSVDPDHDTPAVLADYASHFPGGDGLTLLTGERAAVEALVVGGFKLGLARGDAGPEAITHSDRLALVDGDGHVRGYYSPFEAASRQRLLADMARLSR